MDEQCLPELIEEVLVDSLYYLRYPYTQVLFPMTCDVGYLYAQDRLLGDRQATGQEWPFLTRTMQTQCKVFGTTMDVEGQVGTISVK